MSIFAVIKSKISILDVINDYVQMKRIGGYWKGPCPLHSEKDASFTVSPERQIFYCFGCHAGGDLIAFIAKIENLTQIEAAYYLVDKYSVELPVEEKKDFKKRETIAEKDRYFQICNVAALWFHEQFLAHKPSQEYLEKRGFCSPELKLFEVGYFPGGNRFLNRLIKDMAKQNILVQDLITTGIIARGRNLLYSSFEERILFPIKDQLGRCCGFGGRIFRAGDERAKYYNSRESLRFSKGQLLFGLDIAKKEMQTTEFAYLVEGYTDCLAMVGAGYRNTIATLGTACSADHLKLLSRYIKKLYILYDGDSAGQNAILRLTKLCWEASLDLQIIQLKAKEDPASFIQAGGDLKALVTKSVDIFTFYINCLGTKFWGKSLSEKMELCEKIIQVIAKIDDLFKKDILLHQAASIMQVPFDSLMLLAKKSKQKVKEKSDLGQQKVVADIQGPDISNVEEKIISLVVSRLSSDFPLQIDKNLLPYFSDFAGEILKKAHFFIEKTDKRTFDSFLDFIGDRQSCDWIVKTSFLIEQDQEDDALDPLGYENRLFEKLLFRFQKNNWKQIVQGMKSRIFQAKKQDNNEDLQELLNLFLKLKQEMKGRGLI